MRSLKRWLKNAGPQSEVRIAGQRLKLADTITEMMAALRRELMDKSTLGARKHDRLQVMLGVPANANSNQRFLTQEAASAAGFEVLGLLNEPSAAAIEFAYRNSSDRKRRTRGGLLVYDLGGGTFDVSLVALGETEHSVIASDGIADFGGDDFDEILGRLVLAKVGRPQEKEESLTAAEWYLLFDECRETKEALNTNSRRLTVDLERVRKDWGEVSISADAFYEQCRPLVEEFAQGRRRSAGSASGSGNRYFVLDGWRIGATFGRSSFARNIWAKGSAFRLYALRDGDWIGDSGGRS